MKRAWVSLAAVCALVIAVYVFTAHTGTYVSGSLNAAENSYNLLVQGFRGGQLSLKKEAPPGVTRLRDPYDPTQNRRYRAAPYWMHDLTYYKGRLFIYFGVTPAVILFWPYVALTGCYLSYRQAGIIFCSVGFLASVSVLLALWRRHFAEISVWVVAAGVLALGLATGVPLLLAWCDIYEVAISCAYAFAMLALAAVWKALYASSGKCRWLAAASLAYGLAVGARPTLLFGASILLVPVAQMWREPRKLWVPLLAATGPIMLIGFGLMVYNYLRFDNPLEFGWNYQVNDVEQRKLQAFSVRFLWLNFGRYFLQPARWSGRFPFVHGLGAGETFGILADTPLVWLAVTVPLVWRGRPVQTPATLTGFLTAVTLLFVTCILTMGLFFSASCRYEIQFVPSLMLLAMTGVLVLERTLSNRRTWRWAFRCGWALLLAFSVTFNLLASVERCAEADFRTGVALYEAGKVREAVQEYEQALRLDPDNVEAHNNLGNNLLRSGKIQEAIGQYEQTLRLKPDFAEAHDNLGLARQESGNISEAMEQYEQAFRLQPDKAMAHVDFGIALERTGKLREAIGHYEEALRIEPDSAEAHYNMGIALARLGRTSEAIGQFEQALRVVPDYAEAHDNLAITLAQVGRLSEAIQHWELALRLKPNDATVHSNLGLGLMQAGRFPEAVAHCEQALRIDPDYAGAHYNLALALERQGRTQEAIRHCERALKLRPDLPGATEALARLRPGS
ncbi:MAG TPA: tetratricopeptide repeat protein [Verrucomicrobiae bacterium]|nr:tetratricopeptide repeat protein [Verrucomicrobiae bacterium]